MSFLIGRSAEQFERKRDARCCAAILFMFLEDPTVRALPALPRMILVEISRTMMWRQVPYLTLRGDAAERLEILASIAGVSIQEMIDGLAVLTDRNLLEMTDIGLFSPLLRRDGTMRINRPGWVAQCLARPWSRDLPLTPDSPSPVRMDEFRTSMAASVEPSS